MKITKRDTLPDMRKNVQPVVEEYLSEYQEDNAFTMGDIVDVATIDKKEPYTNFNINKEDLTGSSKRIIEHAVNTKIHTTCLAVVVELRCGDMIVDLFSNDTNSDSYPSVERLALAIDVDKSSIHHLSGNSGNDVRLKFKNNRWKIVEHIDDIDYERDTIDIKDFIRPLFLSGLSFALSMLLGVTDAAPLVPSVVVGVVTAIVLYTSFLYLDLAVKRDHELPRWLVSTSQLPEYEHPDMSLRDHEEEKIVDVENAEFKQLITLADEDAFNDKRAVLHNLAIVVNIPPIGEKVVKVPTPSNDWSNSTCSRMIYSMAPTIQLLGHTTITTVPISISDGELVIDEDQLDLEGELVAKTTLEEIADKYVGFINSYLGAKTREEMY